MLHSDSDLGAYGFSPSALKTFSTDGSSALASDQVSKAPLGGLGEWQCLLCEYYNPPGKPVCGVCRSDCPLPQTSAGEL